MLRALNLLDKRNLTWAYYAVNSQVIWDAPAALLQYYKSPNIIYRPSQVLEDIAACRLRNVSYVTPGGTYSDHAGNTADNGGPARVASIVNAIRTNRQCANGVRYWQDTAIIITWDDWGDWYDHVLPPTPDSSCGPVHCSGFRVPLLVTSAYTPARYVSNTTLDFGSILKTIEEVFHLPCIGTGTWADCSAVGLDEFFTGAERQYEPIHAKPFIGTNDTSGPDDD